MKRIFFAALLAAVFALSASAGKTVEINFGGAHSDLSSTALTKSSIKSYITKGSSYIDEITYIERVYGPKPDGGLKFGSKSGGGTLAFSLSTEATMMVGSVVISACSYGSDDPTVGFWINDEEDAYVFEVDGEYTSWEIELDAPVLVTDFEIQTLKRAYISGIAFIEAESAAEPTHVAAPTFNCHRGEITIAYPGATQIAYAMIDNDSDEAITDVTNLPNAVCVTASQAVVSLDADATIIAQAFVPGFDADLNYSETVAGPTITRSFVVDHEYVEAEKGWLRVTDTQEVTIGSRYLIAAPTVGKLMLSSMENSKKAYDSAPVDFSDDLSMITSDVDESNVLTYRENSAGLHGFQFPDDTFLSVSGDNLSNGLAITGSGNTSVTINDDAFAVIRFGGRDDRQLLYHEGYDFRYGASVNDDNPTFAMPALYTWHEGGEHEITVIRAIVDSPSVALADGSPASEISSGQTVTVSTSDGCEIELMIAENSVQRVVVSEIPAGEWKSCESNEISFTADVAVGSKVSFRTYDPYTFSCSPVVEFTVAEPSGIEDIIVDEDVEIGRYDILGRSVTKDYHGTVIVRHASGRVEKRVNN